MLKYCISIFTTHYSGAETMPIKKLVKTKKNKVPAIDRTIKLKADLKEAKAELQLMKTNHKAELAALKLMKANHKAELVQLKIDLKKASVKPASKTKKPTTKKRKIVRAKKN